MDGMSTIMRLGYVIVDHWLVYHNVSEILLTVSCVVSPRLIGSGVNFSRVHKGHFQQV